MSRLNVSRRCFERLGSRSRLETITPMFRSRLGLGIIRLVYNPGQTCHQTIILLACQLKIIRLVLQLQYNN